jgi:hypothetical protein
LIAALTAALALWGVLHAIGAVRLNNNVWRGVVVFATMAAFLGLWLLLLWRRSRAG